METKKFKEIFEENCRKLNLEKFKTSFFIESEDSIIFLILRKSGFSKKYYLRVKVALKPIESNFEKAEFIKHDISEIFLSLETESPEIFDLENQLLDSERLIKMQSFFLKNVENWIKILSSKSLIIENFNKEKLSLLPYTKNKIGVE